MVAAKKKTTENNGFDNVMSFSPDAFKDSYEKFSENVNAFADFNKGALDAMMASAGAYSDGLEKITAENTAYLKSAYESAVSAAKTASGAQSAQEAFDAQADFARESAETHFGQMSKVSEMWMDTTKKSVAPLSERYSELVEKIQAFRP